MDFRNALLILLVSASSGLAADIQYEIGGGYAYFAGQQYKSLAPKTGYLVRFGAGAGRKNIFKWVSNLTLVSSSGTTDFNDAGTYRNLQYNLVAGEFNLGFKLAFLAPMERLPVQPYLGASGSAMSASFAFPENATVSDTFPKTEAQNYYGYNIFVGVDIEFNKKMGVNLQVEQSKISGTLAQSAFALDSNRILISLFFRE